ncbi:hypothetical protein RJ639_003256, partial [Escallonia herrerae]
FPKRTALSNAVHHTWNVLSAFFLGEELIPETVSSVLPSLLYAVLCVSPENANLDVGRRPRRNAIYFTDSSKLSISKVAALNRPRKHVKDSCYVNVCIFCKIGMTTSRCRTVVTTESTSAARSGMTNAQKRGREEPKFVKDNVGNSAKKRRVQLDGKRALELIVSPTNNHPKRLHVKDVRRKEFRYFADICFSHFGDRVKHWFTLNEPWSFSYYGYVLGTLAPGRCSSWQHRNCTGGNSGEEPYLVTHNQILAHAAAVKVYRDRYQKGGIGITLVSQYYEPCSDSNSASGDEAVQRGRFLHPITYGDYTETMRSLSKLLSGSFDFLGVNYYTTYYAVDAPKSNGEHPSYLTDSQVNFLTSCNGIPIGPRAGNSDWLYIYPKGLRKLLNYIKQNYKDPPMEDGINMLGYFVWSLMDNFEWNSGSSARFGVNYVDYKHGLHRYAKLSALWFKRFLLEEGSVSVPRILLDRGKDTYSVSSSVI